jgi:hypothetical protein
MCIELHAWAGPVSLATNPLLFLIWQDHHLEYSVGAKRKTIRISEESLFDPKQVDHRERGIPRLQPTTDSTCISNGRSSWIYYRRTTEKRLYVEDTVPVNNMIPLHTCRLYISEEKIIWIVHFRLFSEPGNTWFRVSVAVGKASVCEREKWWLLPDCCKRGFTMGASFSLNTASWVGLSRQTHSQIPQEHYFQ